MQPKPFVDLAELLIGDGVVLGLEGLKRYLKDDLCLIVALHRIGAGRLRRRRTGGQQQDYREEASNSERLEENPSSRQDEWFDRGVPWYVSTGAVGCFHRAIPTR